MSKEQPRQAIALIRVSTDQQDCERQRRDVAAAAKIHNLRIVRTLELEGLSGTKMLSNAEVGRVLDDLSRPEIGGVVVSAIDRLTRPGELGHLSVFDFFQRSKKLIWTAGQECDINTLPGFLTLGIQGVLSGVERMTIISRLKGGKETVRLRGGNVDSSKAIPRGLSYTKSGGWAYTADSLAVKQAYALLFEGRSWKDIAARIGWKHHESVCRTLRNPVWKGVRVYTHGRDVPLAVPMGIEPLITPERWAAAQAIMDRKHEEWRRNKRPARLLLTGLLTCACGKPMYLRNGSSTKPRSYYYCSTGFPGRGPACGAKTIQLEAADIAVLRMIARELSNVAFLRTVLSKLAANQPARKGDADKLARERSKLEAQRERLVTLVVEGTLTSADFKRQSERIETALRVLDATGPMPVPDAIDPAKLAAAIVRTFARFGHPQRPFEKRRAALQAAVKGIVIENSQITAATLNGAFLASVCANPSQQSSRSRKISTIVPDVVLRFPKPIPVVHTDNRRRNASLVA